MDLRLVNLGHSKSLEFWIDISDVKVAILSPWDEVAERFKVEGFDVLAIPFIRIVRRKVDFDPREFDVLIVTSKTSARIIVENEIKHGCVIAIGRKTAEVLRKAGMNPKVPSSFDSKTLYKEFFDELKDKRVAILRSNMGDPTLLKIPNAKEIVLYDIEFEWGEEQEKFLRDLDFDAIVFSSRMIVRSFFELSKRLRLFEDVVDALKDRIVVAIGPPTRNELEKYGVKAEIPREWTFDGVLEVLRSYGSL